MILKSHHLMAAVIISVSLILSASVSAKDKVVVIPLMEEKLVQPQYPCTGPDEVVSNGRCWKDRNLGANRVATSMTDVQAFGDLYQWGRLGDGHQNRTSSDTGPISANDVPGHNEFIKSNGDTEFDWRYPQNDILWQGLSSVNNPCPKGFRVPTTAEWNVEISSWGPNPNHVDAYASPLKLVVAGYRSLDGEVKTHATGYYWSSTISGFYANRFQIGSGGVSDKSVGRGYGYSVRCVKD